MLLRVIIVVLFAQACLSAPTPEFAMQLAEFSVSWNEFMISYFGCPRDWKIPSDCSPSRGVLDYQKFFKSRRLAKKIFDFE